MNLMIIGNGFDLDLGRKSRYSDYRNSRHWPFSKINHNGIGYYIENFAKTNSNWFDIEQLLREYSKVDSKDYEKMDESLQPTKINQDELDFKYLNKGLSKYIESINLTPIRLDSAAAKVLNAVLLNGSYKIYSFNYSSLKVIARLIGFKHHFEHEHVHGLAANKSAILGVDDEVDLREGYDFMYKTFSRFYKSHPIQYDLQEADEIILFGLIIHIFKIFFVSFVNRKIRIGKNQRR